MRHVDRDIQVVDGARRRSGQARANRGNLVGQYHGGIGTVINRTDIRRLHCPFDIHAIASTVTVGYGESNGGNTNGIHGAADQAGIRINR